MDVVPKQVWSGIARFYGTDPASPTVVSDILRTIGFEWDDGIGMLTRFPPPRNTQSFREHSGNIQGTVIQSGNMEGNMEGNTEGNTKGTAHQATPSRTPADAQAEAALGAY
jgi:hypothetical protein